MENNTLYIYSPFTLGIFLFLSFLFIRESAHSISDLPLWSATLKNKSPFQLTCTIYYNDEDDTQKCMYLANHGDTNFSIPNPDNDCKPPLKPLNVSIECGNSYYTHRQ